MEHDGNPFEFHSPHGEAVITGTIFDVKVTKAETTLVVSEGSVQFGSAKGMVQVGENRKSTLEVGSLPTEPVSCDAKLLIGWAIDKDGVPSVEFADLFEELLLLPSFLGQPVDLDSLDYEKWAEEKRDWFKGQFPWIFELQKKLEIEVDYPELLMQSGDIWQVVYPHRFYKKIPIAQESSLSRIVDKFASADTGSPEIMSSVRSMERLSSEMFIGQEALNVWYARARELLQTCDRADKMVDLAEPYPI